MNLGVYRGSVSGLSVIDLRIQPGGPCLSGCSNIANPIRIAKCAKRSQFWKNMFKTQSQESVEI